MVGIREPKKLREDTCTLSPCLTSWSDLPQTDFFPNVFLEYLWKLPTDLLAPKKTWKLVARATFWAVFRSCKSNRSDFSAIYIFRLCFLALLFSFFGRFSPNFTGSYRMKVEIVWLFRFFRFLFWVSKIPKNQKIAKNRSCFDFSIFCPSR